MGVGVGGCGAGQRGEERAGKERGEDPEEEGERALQQRKLLGTDKAAQQQQQGLKLRGVGVGVGARRGTRKGGGEVGKRGLRARHQDQGDERERGGLPKGQDFVGSQEVIA